MVEALKPVAVGLLRHLHTTACVFWCADGEDGFLSTHAVWATHVGDGMFEIRMRSIGPGGLDALTGTS